MDSSSNNVNLISLGSSNFNDSVRNSLLQLGSTVTTINPKHWLQTDLSEDTHSVVLALERHDFSNKQILAAILRTSSIPYLAILANPINRYVREIIASCNECCIWPCNPQELEFRLDRVKSITTKNYSGRSRERGTDEWMTMNLVGQSTPFQKVLSIIKNSASCEAPVLIEGETGTGKDMVARAIHYLGTRQDFPFIPVNCGAIPDHLIENELFGHEKGAYTDAKQSQKGLIAQTEGGTLFLDEIEALSAKGQVTLLRFIEDHVIRPLGAKQTKIVDVRIIAASNAPLFELVEKGLFRRDLLFRLNLISIAVPPLRERASDIHHLAEFFMQKYRKQYQQPNKHINTKIMDWMIKYPWPGNVRELDNFIHRAFLTSTGPCINQVEGLPLQRQTNNPPNFNVDESYNEAKAKVINDFEQRYLIRLISSSNGNVTKAAAAAQKERRAFGKLLKKHHIDPAQYRNN